MFLITPHIIRTPKKSENRKFRCVLKLVTVTGKHVCRQDSLGLFCRLLPVRRRPVRRREDPTTAPQVEGQVVAVSALQNSHFQLCRAELPRMRAFYHGVPCNTLSYEALFHWFHWSTCGILCDIVLKNI